MELSKLSTKCKWGLYYWSLFCPIYIIYLYEVSYTFRLKVTHEETYHPLEYALLISAAQFVWRVIAYYIYWRLDTIYIFFVSSMFEAVAMPVITWTNIILCSLGGPQLIPGAPYASVMSSIIDPDHKYFILDVLFCVMELAWMVTCVWLHYVLWTEDFERKREKFKLPVHCKREDIATSQYQSYRMTDRDEFIKVAFFLMWCYVCLYLPYNLDLENLRRNHTVN